MRLTSPIAGRTVLCLTTAGFLLTLGISFMNLHKYEEISRIELSDTTWVVAQTRYEILRFANTLASYIQPRSTVSQDDLAHRLDVLWSRLPLFLEGPQSARYAVIPGLQSAVRRLEAMLQEIDEQVKDLQKGDFDTYDRLLARFQEQADPLDALIVSALISDEGKTIFYNAKLEQVYVTLLVAFAGVLASGTGLIVLLLRQNVTARRAGQAARDAGARLRLAIGSIADGFVLFDSTERIILCNDKFSDLQKVAGAALRPEHPAGGVRRDAGDHRGSAGTRNAQRCPDRGGPFELEMSDGRWIRVNERKTPDGGRVGILTDITELKRREAALREAKEQADRANKAKSAFLATMSHELRTPLNAIIGFSEMMAEQILGPVGNDRYAEYAIDIRDSGRHLLAIINDILDMAKIESGKLEMLADAFAPEPVIRDVLWLLRERAQAAGVEMTCKGPGDHCGIHGDQKLFRQILLNLYSNALKFTGRGGRIHTEIDPHADGSLALRITDTGIGIAAEDLDRVLQPFVQVENHLQRKYDGTGLGLPLVKAMVDLHEGSFELESRLGAGTTAIIRLPARRTFHTPEQAIAMPVPEPRNHKAEPCVPDPLVVAS
jgi:signal transduction histidine kinase